MPQRVIQIHAQAPAKPVEGAVCNGCGVCCSAEPCPIGQWLSRRRHGTCNALQWDATQHRYHCGVMLSPRRWLTWLPETLGRSLAGRWIAAGIGCDSDYECGPGDEDRLEQAGSLE